MAMISSGQSSNYAVAIALLDEVDFQLDEHCIVQFILAYQAVSRLKPVNYGRCRSCCAWRRFR